MPIAMPIPSQLWATGSIDPAAEGIDGPPPNSATQQPLQPQPTRLNWLQVNVLFRMPHVEPSCPQLFAHEGAITTPTRGP
jgi:hypothetical protein